MSRTDDRPDAPAPIRRSLVDRIGVLRPLRIRDFRLMWTGLTVSLIGDGIYLVAVAWQAYDLSSAPTALSVVGLSQSLPLIAFIVLGGVLSDRLPRRNLMVASDLIRGAAVATIGILSITGNITLPLLIALTGLYGLGQALFYPAFGSIVPELVPDELLVQANSLDQFVRPLTFGVLGPAVGGAVISGAGVGWGFILDAVTFCLSATAVAMMRVAARPEKDPESKPLAEVKEGLAFVRSQPWLWATLLAAAVALLMFVGPYEVLVPHVIKFDMGGDAGDLGALFAAGGIGSILAALLLGQFGFPRRYITFMYWSWAIGILAVAGYGVMNHLWEGMVMRALGAMLATAGMVVWATLMHRHVPKKMLGRVTSLDWLVSLSLIPLSFGITGPIAELVGVRATLIAGGLTGTAVTVAFLYIPGVRDLERAGALKPDTAAKAHDVEAVTEEPQAPR